MDLFSIFTMLGGLALFLYGMNILGSGLEKVSGGKLEIILEKLTNTPLKGVLLGTVVTAIIQSSSATTVMVVGFVNSGIMKLSQAIGIIMGANIGTTATGWILSLSGIQGEGLLRLLKPETFSPILAFIGIILLMLCKKERKKDIGTILLGFSVLMFGMTTISEAVSPLKDVPEFANILMMFENPLLGILAGIVVTAVLQSSSASVGILQALSVTGNITYGSAITIIMGMSIGASVPPLLSCIGANKNAKRAAIVYLYFNILGTLVSLPMFYLFNYLSSSFGGGAFFGLPANIVGIAMINTVFKVFSTIVLLPFSKQIGKLAKFSIRDKHAVQEQPFIDERFLNAPSFAIEQCKSFTIKMAKLAKQILLEATTLVDRYDTEQASSILKNEELIDTYEDELGTYLVKLSSKELTIKDSNEVSKLLHTMNDFERIADHAVNILHMAKKKHEIGNNFSQEALEELKVLTDALYEILALTLDAFIHNDIELAEKVEPLEQVIDGLANEMKARHIRRLKQGDCNIEMGFIFSDLLSDYERVSDHCSNVAVCLIQINESAFETHSYLNEVKSSGQPEFVANFKEYKNKYFLPAAQELIANQSVD